MDGMGTCIENAFKRNHVDIVMNADGPETCDDSVD